MLFARHFPELKTTKMMTTPASNALRRARLTQSVGLGNAITILKYGENLIDVNTCGSIGTAGIIKKIRDTVGDGPVYLSIDVRIVCIPCEHH